MNEKEEILIVGTAKISIAAIIFILWGVVDMLIASSLIDGNVLFSLIFLVGGIVLLTIGIELQTKYRCKYCCYG